MLFLDELSEFPRPSLEALRQPLEDGRVAIVRGQRTAIFPTRFMLVAATNPCPCGHAPSTALPLYRGRPRAPRAAAQRPALDRIDLVLNVQRPAARDLARAGATTSAAERDRVMGARERQGERLRGTGVACNAHMDSALLRSLVTMSPEAERTLLAAYRAGRLSARGRDRALRVAQTVADLAGAAGVDREHIVTALGYRHEQDLDGEAVA